MNVDSILKVTRSITRLRGNTDNTLIGNVADALKVTGVSISGGSDFSALVAANKLYGIGLDVVAASSGVDNPLILIRNPIGSGKDVYIFRILVGIDITNVAVEFNVFSNPTVTANGTAKTPTSRNVGGGAPSAITLINTLPTVSANGGVLQTYAGGQNTNSFGIEENFSLLIKPNNSILITGDPSSNSRNTVNTILWAEI